MFKKITFILVTMLAMGIFLTLDLIFFQGKIVADHTLISIFRWPKIAILCLGTLGATFATYVTHLLTKNRVTDIGTIGISSLNLLLFVLAYSTCSIQTFIWMRKYVMWIIYLCGSIGILLIIFLLTFRFKKSMNKIVLIGIVFSLFISALSYLFIARMPDAKQAHVTEISVGTIRDHAEALTDFATFVAEGLLIAALILYSLFYHKIKVVYTDELRARSLGINVLWTRWVQMLIIALASTAAFLLLGSIAFIGFVAANITYIFFKRLTYYRLFITFTIALTLMLIVYFINFSWLYWNIAIGIVSNVIALPYLVIVLLSRKQQL